MANGWHYGGGVPPQEKIRNIALTLNREARIVGFTQTDAFPGIDGEIQFTVYEGDDYLEFTINVDGRITFVWEKGDEEVEYVERLSLRTALQKLGEIREKEWPSLGSSTYSIMTVEKKDLRALHSSPQAMGVVYQSLTEGVRCKQAELYANILRASTGTYLATLLFSGLFQITRSLQSVNTPNKQAPPEIDVITT